MNLLVVFLVVLLICQSISVGLGLLAERMFTPYTGLVTFIVLLLRDVRGGVEDRGPAHRAEARERDLMVAPSPACG